MVNSADFGKRVKELLDYYELSAAGFADKIGVGRSSISHILSGRNKPSLEFITKILRAYPEVDLYWLMNGKGHFLKESDEQPPTEETTRQVENTESSKQETSILKNNISQNPSNTSKEIHKVIIFYKDGSFDAFEN